MAAIYTFDVFTSLDGYGAAGVFTFPAERIGRLSDAEQRQLLELLAKVMAV